MYNVGHDRDQRKQPHSPQRPEAPAASSESQLSLMEFVQTYPDDAACLDRLWRKRYAPDGHHARCPRCERERKFHRTTSRAVRTPATPAGCHIHPMKGTIFEKSTTSLVLWFYAMYFMASTRCGVSAKQLERELGRDVQDGAPDDEEDPHGADDRRGRRAAIGRR